uniref:Uncharacterized protein n=1 Tax=Melopsittacus undulatus TaxID=13146 RepID=A0A8V5GSR1_MELUD
MGCGDRASALPLLPVGKPSAKSFGALESVRNAISSRSIVGFAIFLSAPDAGEKEVDPEQCPKLPDATVSKSGPSLETTGAVRRKSSHRTPSVRNNPLSPNLRHRLSLKTKGRKSLPPIHQDVTELSKAISLDLPEGDRLFELLFSSFQFAAQKLEQSLKHKDGFNPEAFRSSAQSAGEDLKYSLQQLRLKGTLQRCEALLWPRFTSGLYLLYRLTAESHAWDELLLRHQESAEEAARRLEERRDNTVPVDYLHTSQAEVLRSKPNYQQILAEQREVLTSMELLVSWVWGKGDLGAEFLPIPAGIWRLGFVLNLRFCSLMSCSKRGSSCRPSQRRASSTCSACPRSSVRGVGGGVEASRGGPLTGFNGGFPPVAAARTFGHLEQSPVRKLIAGPPRRQRQPLH